MDKFLFNVKCAGTFFSQVFSAFEIENTEELDVKLYNPQKAPIAPEKLSQFLQQYKLCSFFHIAVVFPDGIMTGLSNLVLEQYLRDNGCEYLFTQETIRGFLSSQCQKELFKQVTNFISSTYTLNASEDEMIDVCLAVVALFPSLKTSPSKMGGNDALYDPAKERGKIFQCVKYRQTKGRRLKKAAIIDENISVAEIENSILDVDAEELYDFLDGCVLPQDLEKLKQKMFQTIETRRRMFLLNNDLFPKMFHLYLIDPALINFDFSIMYPDIDEHVLANVWNRIQKKPIQTLNINLLSNEPVFNRDADLYHFFTYMKMLPCHKIKFENAARTFMVFSDNPNAEPLDLRNKKNPSPYFIFISWDEEKKFYIHVHDRLVSVPKEFNFVEALDLYYKIHKVFQIPFHKHLQQVMGFIGAFVYQMNEDEALLSAKSLSFKHIISDSIDQQSN